jgi:predicted O-linked N-acetylglucosamine transferase (SPINDLY family)
LFPHLSRDEFEPIAIFVAPVVDDDYSRFIRQHADRSLVVPRDLAQARQAIESLQLDILFYQDIGMEPFTYLLAFSRLAPVQCVSFGHPDTTGIPNIDYWVSNDLYETADAAGHYSEKLFLLRDLGCLAYYYKPELPQPLKRRADFGLDDDDRLYICPQNLFKFHPDMDELIAGILRRDPRGKLLLIEGRVPAWTGRLRARWAGSMPDVIDRIVFLPRQNTPDYVNLIAVSDVMLDTIHLNGMNTSLEALSVGTPIVTLPGRFQRGRHTQAMYRKIGIAECIADSPAHYVEIAVRLANDPSFAEPIRAAIRERAGVLFEDVQVVREFERFFREALAAQSAASRS